MKVSELILIYLDKILEKKKAVEILERAKYSLGNFVGNCNCSKDNPCVRCKQALKVWDEIDEFAGEEE